MVGRFINFLLVPLYTSKLNGPDEYGIVSVLFSFAAFIGVVLTYGLETSFFNFSRESTHKKKVFNSAFGSIMITTLVFIVVSVFFKDSIASWVEYPSNPEFILYFIFILALDALCAIPFARLRIENRAITFATLKLINIGINVAANLYLLVLIPILKEWGYSGLLLDFYDRKFLIHYIFISNLVASLFTFIVFLPRLIREFKPIDKELLKSMLKYGLPLLIVGLAGMINETIDRILLKKILPNDIADYQVGIYSAFYKLSMIITIFVQAFRYAAEPFFFQMVSDRNSSKIYAKVMTYFIYVVMGFYLITILLLTWIAPLLIQKTEYFQDPNGMFVVPILLLANVFLGIYYNLAISYKLTGKTMMGVWIALSGALITIVLNLIFIPIYGFVASAIVTMIAYFVMCLLGYYFGKVILPIPYEVVKNISSILVVVVLAFFGSFWMEKYHSSVIFQLLFTIVLTFLYGLFVFFMEKRGKRLNLQGVDKD